MKRLVSYVDFTLHVYRQRIFDINIHAHPRFTELYDIETIIHTPQYSYNDILITPFRQVEYISDPFTSSKQDTPSFFEVFTVSDGLAQAVYIGSDLKAMEPISERWHKPVGRFHTLHTASESYSMPVVSDLFYTLVVSNYTLLKFVQNYVNAFGLTVLESRKSEKVGSVNHQTIDDLFDFGDDSTIKLFQQRVQSTVGHHIDTSSTYLLYSFSAVIRLPLQRTYNFGLVGGSPSCGDLLVEVYVDNQLVFSSYDPQVDNEWSVDIPLSEGFHSLTVVKIHDTSKSVEKHIRLRVSGQTDYEVSVDGLQQMSVDVFAPVTIQKIQNLKQFIFNPFQKVNTLALLLKEYTPVVAIVKPETTALEDYKSLVYLFQPDTVSIRNGSGLTTELLNPQYTYSSPVLQLIPDVELPPGTRSDAILFIRYKGKSGHPSDHQGLINDYDVSTVYYTGFRQDIDTGNYGDYYNMFFCCYLNVEDEGTWYFAVDGDDAVEVEVDGQVVASWYGGHGTCNCQDHSGSIELNKGSHQLIFRHEEDVGGDWARLYFKSPSMSSWQVFTVQNLKGKATVSCLVPNERQIETMQFLEQGCNALPRGSKTKPLIGILNFNTPKPFNLLILDDTQSDYKFEYLIMKAYDSTGQHIDPENFKLDPDYSFNVKSLVHTSETVFIYRENPKLPVQIVFDRVSKISGLELSLFTQFSLKLALSLGAMNYSDFKLVDATGSAHPLSEVDYELATHYDDISAVPEIYHHRQLPRDIKTGTDYVIFGLQQGINDVDVHVLGTAFEFENRGKIADSSFRYLAIHNVYSDRYNFNIYDDFGKTQLLPWSYVGYASSDDQLITTSFDSLNITVTNMSNSDLDGVFVFSVPHVSHSWQGKVDGNTVPIAGVNHVAMTQYQKDKILFLRYAADCGNTDNHQQMIDSFVYTNLQYKGLTDSLNKGGYGDCYHMMFVTWIYVKQEGTWTFQIEADDRVEIEIDGNVFFNTACCSWQSTTYNLSKGFHKLIVRFKEWWVNDYVHVQVKPPGVSDWIDFTVENLTNYLDCYAYVPTDDVLKTKEFIVNGLTDMPDFVQYASNLEDWKTDLIGVQMQVPASSTKVLTLTSGDFSDISSISQYLVPFDKYLYKLDVYPSSLVIVNAGKTPAKSARTLFMMDDDTPQPDTSLQIDRNNIALLKCTLLAEVGKFPSELILDVSSFSHMYGQSVPFTIFDVSNNSTRAYIYLDETDHLTKSLWSGEKILVRLVNGTLIDEALQPYLKQGYTAYYMLSFDKETDFCKLTLDSSNFDFSSVSSDGRSLIVLDKNFEEPVYYTIDSWDSSNQNAELTLVFKVKTDKCYLVVGKL